MKFYQLGSQLALACTAVLLSACSGNDENATASNGEQTDGKETVVMVEPTGMRVDDNPFFTVSELDLQYPRFDLIRNEHYRPAFLEGMKQHLAEISEITSQTALPTFANTIVPLEISGQLLNRVATVFFSLGSAHTNDSIQKLEIEISPLLSAHNDSILFNSALFARVKAVYDSLDNAGLDSESARLVVETYKDFIRAGAILNVDGKEKLRAINNELAELGTVFDQNVLKEVNESAITVDNREDLAGFSDAQIEGASEAAEARGLSGKFVIPLLNTSGQPALSELANRELRQHILETSLGRGSSGGAYDNTRVLSRTARLRAERAQLLGYPNHAAYVLEEQTAQTVEAVNLRLATLTPPAIANARREAEELQTMIRQEGGDFKLAAWDWAWYSEKVRQAQFSFDEARLTPFLELDNVLHKGVFYAASQIYGITFAERNDLPVYQEDVRVFDVTDVDGTRLAIYILDPFARSSKRGGAWMNEYVAQSTLMETRTVVANHLNIPRPPDGEPVLMKFDEVITLFHEFGHALHGMFSNVTYTTFSGTNVPSDFVEYPSQVNEMWAVWPEVLRNYAVHHETGEPMPAELLDKVLASRKFGQGFATSEYLMAALTDMALHTLQPEEVPSAEQLMQFEADTLSAAGARMDALPPRYRLPYFSHIMGGYAAGYYAYIWSEVLDADTVSWFRENGGMSRENGQHFRETLLSRGGSEDAMALFMAFRSREPDIASLLERRGLDSGMQ